MDERRAAVSDTALLKAVLRRLDLQQTQDLYLAFGSDSALADALRQRLREWRDPAQDLPAQDGGAPTFFGELVRFLARRGMTDAKLYNAIGMQRTLWYRLRDNPEAHTSKANVLKMGIVLQLDYWELYYLVSLSGYAFVPAYDGADREIASCVRAGIYAPAAIDERLYAAGEPTLFSRE